MSRLTNLRIMHDLYKWDNVAFAVGYMKKHDPKFKKSLYHHALNWSNGGAYCLD